MRKPKGITLLELIMAMALLVIVLGVICYAFTVGLKIFTGEVARTDVLVEATRGINHLVDELRGALSVGTGEAHSITFWWKDLNNNGFQEAEETVTYSWSGTPQDRLLRSVAGGSSTLANNIESFELTYDDPGNIRHVTIILQVKKGEDSKILKSSVKLRNL